MLKPEAAVLGFNLELGGGAHIFPTQTHMH